MRGDPQDMFEEMDAMFARLFHRMDREFMAGGPQVFEYRFVTGNESVQEEAREYPAPSSGTAREPVAEVHRIDDETRVIAGLPGVSGETIRLAVEGSTLVIDAGTAENHYRTSAALPPVDVSSMQQSFRNGVLEVSFRNLPGAADDPDPGNP